MRLYHLGFSLGLSGLGLAALLTACSGSSSSTPMTAATATPTPASVSTTAPIPAAGGSLALASVGGYGLTLLLSAGAPAGDTITATSSLAAPANAPAPSSERRQPQSIAGATSIFYVTFTVSQTTSAQIFTGENLTVISSLPAGAQHYAEVDDITAAPATKLASFGPVTAANLIAQFTNNGGSNGGSVNLQTGHTYLFQFYYLTGGATPTPTPSPTPTGSPTASPTPTPTPTASPSGAPTVTPTPTPTPTPTSSVKPNYVFSNTPSQATFTSAGGNAISVGNGGMTLSTNWGATSGASSTTFTANLATGSGDITPSSFPLNTGNGNVVTYIEFTATPDVTFAQTPVVTLTISGGSFGGTTCYIYSLNGGGTTPTWNQVIGPATPSGNTLNFQSATLPAPNTVNVGNPSDGNQVYLSVACV